MHLDPFVYSLLRDVGEISVREYRVVVPFDLAVAHGVFGQQLQARRLDDTIAAFSHGERTASSAGHSPRIH